MVAQISYVMTLNLNYTINKILKIKSQSSKMSLIYFNPQIYYFIYFSNWLNLIFINIACQSVKINVYLCTSIYSYTFSHISINVNLLLSTSKRVNLSIYCQHHIIFDVTRFFMITLVVSLSLINNYSPCMYTKQFFIVSEKGMRLPSRADLDTASITFQYVSTLFNLNYLHYFILGK